MLRRTPLKRTAMKKRRKKDKRTPEEKAYYAWLADQPTVDTGGPCEERHHLRLLSLGAGAGLKTSDWFALPVTMKFHGFCHQRPRESSHTLAPYVRQLWQRYGLDKVPQREQDLLNHLTPGGTP